MSIGNYQNHDIYPAPTLATTNSNHTFPIHQNYLQREFKPKQINQAWSSDITYVWTQEGWLYLAVVMDLYSRQIIGWAMDSRMTDSLVIDAVKDDIDFNYFLQR